MKTFINAQALRSL